jgi:NAD(P)H-nitrite reductase large subunit
MNGDKVTVCRCEEVSRGEILQAIRDGCHSLDSIKKASRAGMGACQGRTCGRLILNILRDQGAKTRETLSYAKARFPVVSCDLDAFLPPDRERG